MVPKFGDLGTEVTLQKLWATSACTRHESTLTKIILDTHHRRSFAFSVTGSSEICYGINFGSSHVYLKRRDRILCVLSASLPQNSHFQPKNEYREPPCWEGTPMIQIRGAKALAPWCRHWELFTCRYFVQKLAVKCEHLGGAPATETWIISHNLQKRK